VINGPRHPLAHRFAHTASDEDHVLSGYLIISIKDKISVNGDEGDQGFEESNVLGDKNRPTIVGPERPPLGDRKSERVTIAISDRGGTGWRIYL
jgi:hypothetical protein